MRAMSMPAERFAPMERSYAGGMKDWVAPAGAPATWIVCRKAPRARNACL